MNIEFIDNSKEGLATMQEATVRALEKCGLTAERYAKLLCPVDTGNLRNSITHQVDEEKLAVYIGTDSECVAYVELGTGKYYEGGTPRPWTYTDAKGKTHWTGRQKAKPYLKPAVADHKQKYKKIIEDELKKG